MDVQLELECRLHSHILPVCPLASLSLCSRPSNQNHWEIALRTELILHLHPLRLLQLHRPQVSQIRTYLVLSSSHPSRMFPSSASLILHNFTATKYTCICVKLWNNCSFKTIYFYNSRSISICPASFTFYDISNLDTLKLRTLVRSLHSRFLISPFRLCIMRCVHFSRGRERNLVHEHFSISR